MSNGGGGEWEGTGDAGDAWLEGEGEGWRVDGAGVGLRKMRYS